MITTSGTISLLLFTLNVAASSLRLDKPVDLAKASTLNNSVPSSWSVGHAAKTFPTVASQANYFLALHFLVIYLDMAGILQVRGVYLVMQVLFQMESQVYVSIADLELFLLLRRASNVQAVQTHSL